MKNRFMHKLQRSDDDAVWWLGRGTSTTLHVRERRVLQACEGRLWVTAEGNDEEAALDVWLMPGDTVSLEPGTRIVVEGWPTARFRLLVPPVAAISNPAWPTRIADLWARWQATRSPALHAGT